MDARFVIEHLDGERVGGRFIIERTIGEGPMSTAFRARDEMLHRRVTVKLFHPAHVDDAAIVDAQLELAKSVARLSHPNIVTVIDRGEHMGLPFIVLEFVRGENLQERIDRFAPLGISEVVSHGLSIARALAYAHSHGVVHGNLRPANVLVSEDRDVKLVDFGGGSYLASLTSVDPYRAPELRLAESAWTADDLNAAHDIYSLGVLLFAALTEALPQADIDAGQVQVLRPDAPPRLAEIVCRALAVDPMVRQGSMQEFAAELASVKVSDEIGDSVIAVDVSDGGMPPAGDAPPVAVTDVGDDSPEHHAAQVRRPERRASLVAWSMVLIPIVMVVSLAWMIAGERGSSHKATSARSSEIARPTVDMPIASGTTFDPGGDRLEHESEVSNAFDGDLATGWQTEGYSDVAFNKVKSGVGLILILDRRSEPAQLRIQTDLYGWGMKVYASNHPRRTLQAWTPISDGARIMNGTVVHLNARGHAYRYYLLWVNRLSLDDSFRARINEVRFKVFDDAAARDHAAASARSTTTSG